MDRERCLKTAALRYVVLLPILLLIAAPAVGAPPTSGTPKVDRHVMGLITPYLDYVRPWINGRRDGPVQALVGGELEAGRQRQVLEGEAAPGRQVPSWVR